MNLKLSKTILLFSGMLFLVFSFSFVFAQEVEYPPVAGAETPTPETPLPEYLKYIFNFSIILSGLLAFGFFVYGGFLYLTSYGDANRMGNAKEQMLASSVGLLIVLGSYMILVNVNPQLVLWKIELKTAEIETPEIPKMPIEEKVHGYQEIPLQEAFDTILDLEKEALLLSEQIYEQTDQITFLSRDGEECLDDFGKDLAELNRGKIRELFRKKTEDIANCQNKENCQGDVPGGEKSCAGQCQNLLEKKEALREKCKKRGGSLLDLLIELGKVPSSVEACKAKNVSIIIGGIKDLTAFCNCGNVTSVCRVPASCACCAQCRWEHDPCPYNLKQGQGCVSFNNYWTYKEVKPAEGGGIPKTLLEIQEGKKLTFESSEYQSEVTLERKIKELKEARLEFDKLLEKVSRCRSDIDQRILTCAEMKNEKVLAKCEELNLYCAY